MPSFDEFITESRIFRDRDVLSPHYIPDTLHFREHQIRELMASLAPALMGKKPRNIFIYGKTGTGKTCSVKQVTQKFEEKSAGKSRIVYINCRIHNKPYRVMLKVAKAVMEGFDRQGYGLPHIYERLLEWAGTGRQLIIILDEIDMVKHLDELLYMHLLAQGRGVELHACGIVDEDGRGHLFVGHSGAGKSTMARQWRGRAGVRVLSDDRIIVRRRSGRMVMYGTPWHGEAGLCAADSAPIVRIYFPCRGIAGRSSPSMRRESRSRCAAELFARSFVPFYRADALAFTLEFLDELTERVDKVSGYRAPANPASPLP